MKRFYHKYMADYMQRTVTNTTISFIVNTFTGIVKLLIGIYFGSVWFIANSVYYLILSAARGLSLKKYKKFKQKKDVEEQYEIECAVYKHNGYLICLLSIAYFGVCVRMFMYGDSIIYRGYTLYLVATIAFTKLGFTLYGTAVARKLKSPIISSLKNINYADVFASIVITENTLLTMEEESNSSQYSAITGIIFIVFIFAVGIMMILKKKQSIKIGFKP